MSSNRSRLLVVCLFAIFALFAESAFATHFRFGYMFWEVVGVSGNLATVRVTVDVGGRWTYPSYLAATSEGYTSPRCTSGASVCCAGVPALADASVTSCPPVGALINFAGGLGTGGIAFDSPGGGTINIVSRHGITLSTPISITVPTTQTNPPTAQLPMDLIVNQVVPTQDTFYGRLTFIMVMDRSKVTRLTWYNSNRISQLLDANNDLPWRIETVIDLTNPNINKSPIFSSSAVVPVYSGQTNIIDLPHQTFDNTVARFRLATSAESQLVNPFPVAPSEFALDQNTGRVTFKPRDNGFYAVQFVMTAIDPVTGAERAKTPLDMMFLATPFSGTVTETLSVSSPSTVAPPPYVAEADVPFSYRVRGNVSPNNPSYRQTISPNTAAPPGAFYTGGTCTGTATCDLVFNWTPSVTSTPSLICYTATVTNGQVTLATSTQLCVQVNLEPLQTELVASDAQFASGGSPVTLKAHLTRTLHPAPIANRRVRFTYLPNPASPPWVQTDIGLGVDTVLTDANGDAVLVVTPTGPAAPGAQYRADFDTIAGELEASFGVANYVPPSATQLTLPAFSGISGQAQPITVTLQTPDNTPVNDATITLTLPGGIVLSAATLADGTATFNHVPAAATSATYQASFAATQGYLASSTTSAYIVNKAATSLAALNMSTTQFVGNALQVSTTLTRTDAPAGVIGSAPVVFTLTGDASNPGGPSTQTVSVQTDAAGTASTQFSLTSRGTFHVTATFATTPTLAASSSAADLTVYQKTFLLVNAAHGVATDPTTIMASLTAIPQNTAVPGAAISFDFAGVVAAGSAVTDNNGAATLSRAFPNPGTYQVFASFLDLAGFYADDQGNPIPSTANATATISSVTTSLDAPAVATSFVGDSVSAQTVLSRVTAPAGVLEGQTVSFALTAPSGSVATQAAVTNAGGAATAAFSFSERGAHTIAVSYAGTTAIEPAAASSSFNVYQRTRLTAPNAAIGAAGAPVTLSVTLSAEPGGAPIANQTVEFTFGGVVPPQSAQTDAAGVASVTIVPPEAGWIDATASFLNAAAFYANHNGALAPETVTTGITVTSAATAFSTIIAQPTALTASAISASITLTRVDGIEIAAGQPIDFTMTAPDGSTSQQTAATDASGNASVSFTTVTRGVHSISAGYAGNAALAPTTSSLSTITVYQRTTLSIAPVTGIAGEPVALTATLRSIPENSVVANQTVTITFVGATQQATTNGAGEATVNVVGPVSGAFAIDASFANGAAFFTDSSGAIPPAPTTAASTLTLARAATDLSNVAAPPAALVAGSISLSATLQRHFTDGAHVPPAGTIVKFTVTGPNGASEIAGATDASGVATVSFTPSVRGVHSVSAAFDANDSMTGSASASSSPFTVYQRTTLTLPNATGSATKPVTISATLTDIPGGAPIAGASVGFQFNGPGAPANVLSATTNANGVATVTVTFPSVAVYSATATFLNLPGFYTNAAGVVPPSPTAATGTIDVTNNAPAFTTPANITAEATGPAGRVVTFPMVGTDIEDGPINIAVCTPLSSGSTFPIATTTVTCTVTDAAGATGSGSFTVTVRDTTAPTLTLPANITTNPTGPGGAAVSYTATASDIVTIPVTPVCSPASATTFAIGTTVVNCTATDGSNNIASGSFTIMVRNPTQAAANLQQIAAAAGMTQGDNNIDNVLKFLNHQTGGSLNAACNNLDSVIKKAQKMGAAGQPVVTAAQNLKATIGCTP